MKDGENLKNLESNSSGKHITDMSNVGIILQSIRIRCSSVFSDIMDRDFIEGESRFVWYCGTIFWIIYLLSQNF